MSSEGASRVGNLFWLKCTLLLLSVIPMEAGFALIPALGMIAKSFPGVNPGIIGLISTIPALGTIIVSIIAGRLAVAFDMKKLVMIGMFLFIIGGVAPVFYPEIWFILICRIILGIGTGLVMPLILGLIAEFFEGNERASMMGFSYAASCVGGMLIAAMAGYLAMVNWHYNFLLYLYGLPVLLFVWLATPKVTYAGKVPGGPMEGPMEGRPKVSAGKGVLTLNVLFFLFINFVVGAVVYAGNTAVPLYVTAANIGSAGQLGISVAIQMGFAFLVSLGFGRIFKSMRMYVWPLSLLLAAISALFVISADSMNLIFVALAFTGFFTGFFTPVMYYGICAVVPREYETHALGLLTAVQNVGMFTSSAALALILGIVGLQNYRGFFVVVLGFCLVMMLIVFIYVAAKTKRIGFREVQSGAGVPGLSD